MPTCHHLAPNGEKSLLYQVLEQKYGPVKAHEVWEQVRSQQFLNKHGDWINFGRWRPNMTTVELAQRHKVASIPMDSNYEPTVAFVEKVLALVQRESSFRPANQQQSEAIEKIQDFIHNGNSSEWFTLEGKAGTGKTTLVQEAIAPFVDSGQKVLIAALSHKAKLVLSNKLEDRFGKSTISSHTIAGALAMSMDEETGEFSPEYGSAYKEKPIETADIIIIDEASMVNEDALELIMADKKPGAKLIFLGDIGQLPPIRDKKKSSVNPDKPSPAFFTKNKAALTERVRQGEESPILPYADLFWNNSQNKKPIINPAPEEHRKSVVTSKGSLVFAKLQSALDQVLPLYRKGVETGNPDIVKTVVYKNDTRRLINSKIREYIFGKTPPQFMVGDLIMFQDNYSTGNMKISNSTEVQVKQVRQATDKDGRKIWILSFGYEGKPIDIEVLDTSEITAYEQHVSKLFSDAKAMPKGHARSAAMQDAWKAKRHYAPVDYSYAITSHKSQGSTYDVVLVGEADIMSVGPTTAVSKSQSIYTAITRARHAAIILDGKHDDAHALPLALEPVINPVAKKPDVVMVQPAQPVVTGPKTYSGEITQLAPNQIFVFGSNTQGRHGKGAALIAKDKFGAKYGQAEGLQGQSYAIITKDLTKSIHPSRTPEQIKAQIKGLYDTAQKNPDKEFLVAYKAGGSNLNAYSSEEMAAFFAAFHVPGNIVFEEGFDKLVRTKVVTTPVTSPVTKPEKNPLTEAGIKPTDMKGNAAKDIAMAGLATQFIGRKSGSAATSSTEKYERAWGTRANTGNYTKDDIIMVSGSGPWRGVTLEQIEGTFETFYKPLLRKAADAGASFVVGNAAGQDKNIRQYLQSRGYTETVKGGYSEFRKTGTVAAEPPMNVWFKTGENPKLSNLYERPFTDKSGRKYFSVEHAYQSWKTGGFDERTYAKYTRGGVKISGGSNVKTENNWNIKFMEGIMRSSFAQNPDAVEALLATGNAPITHTQDGGIWATEFPRILMKLRDEFRATVAVTPVPKAENDIPPPPGSAQEKEVVTREFGTPGKTTEPEKMKEQIEAFYAEARQNPNKIYRVPYVFVSSKHRYSNNYNARQLADLLDSDNIPDNVEFTEDFRRLIENSTRRIIAGFRNDVPVEFIDRNEKEVLESAATLLVPKLNAKGEADGFFSPQQQKEIVDVIVTGTERELRKDPAQKANAILRVFKGFRGKQQEFAATGNVELATHFASVYAQRVRLAEDALRQMFSMGLYTDAKSVSRILAAVQAMEPMTDLEKAEFIAANPDIDPETLDEFTGEFMESQGRITKDWSENTFELDPKDTASARIKFFMGTQFDMDKGSYMVREDGLTIEETEIPADFDKMPAPQALQLAKKLNRRPFWYKDAASSKRLQQWLQANYPRVSKTNFLGVAKTADYEQIFKETLNALGNRSQEATFDEFMAVLDAHPNPTIQTMAQNLRKADQSMKNEFMTVMMKQYQPFTMALFSTKTDYKTGKETYELKASESNRASQHETLMQEWQELQKQSDITIIGPSGERTLDIARIRSRWLPTLKKAQAINDWSKEEHRDWFIKTFGGMLRLSGVTMTDEMMADLFDNPKKWTDSESVMGLFGTNVSGEPTGLLSIFIMRSAGLATTGDDTSLEDALKLSQQNNPLYQEKKRVMKPLAKLAAKYIPVIYSQNHRNAEGKSVWDWGLNTKLSHQFRQLVTDFATFKANADATTISAHNYLLQYFEEHPAALKDTELAYFDGLRPEWSKKGTTRQAMSDREQLLTSVLLFQNRGNGYNRVRKVHYMSLTHSDKTMTPIFRNMPRVDTGRDGVVPASLIGRTDSALYNVFKAEYDRITQHASIDSGSKQYEQGKRLFYFLPDFNHDGMKALVAQEVITQEEMNLIYPGGGKTLTKSIDSEKELPVINKVLTHFMNNLVGNTLGSWKAQGLVTADSFMFDERYVKEIIKENGITTTEGPKTLGDHIAKASGIASLATRASVTYKDINKQPITWEQVVEIVAATAAKEYAVNQFLFNTALSQLFYGDPAQNFKKSKLGTSDLHLVRSTMAEYSKRLAKDIAPRADLYWGKNRTYTSITLAEVMTTEEVYNEIDELRKAYVDNPIESTNAQELVTVQEKIDVMLAMGKISSTVHAEMSAIIKAADGGFYKFTNPEHLAIVMQPEKPLYAGERPPVNGIRLTDYIKTSAYALYPPLTAGKEIDGLRQLMEKNNIQRAPFDTGQKVGIPVQPLQVFTAQGKFIQPTDEALKAATQLLNRNGFGIQQEVPYDTDKEAIKIITQMNENVIEGITHMTGFVIPGHPDVTTGAQVKALKERIRKGMLRYNRKEFDRKLNVDEEGTVDVEEVYDILAEEALRDTRGSYTLNEIQGLLIKDKDGTPMVPLIFSTAADKYAGLLMGMVNHISEFKMPGKSYVQASSTGYRVKTTEETDLSEIVWIGDYDGSPLKPIRVEDGAVKPGQVILPWSFSAPDGTKLRMEDFLIERDGKKYLDPIRVPRELLQLVGARIPNQKHSSMHPLEVVGFVPANMGDMVLIPAALVTQMGGDFDVDKLYTYRRPYYYNEATKELLLSGHKYKEYLGADPEEWQALKAATTESLKAQGVKPDERGFFEKEVFNKALGEVVAAKYPEGNVPKHRVELKKTPSYEDKETLQMDYFNLHWAILTHPDMLKRVMAPLDINDLADESALLRDEGSTYWNYYDPMTQLQDFQSGKEAKRLVGSTSWAVKMSARIQDKNLRYGEVTYRMEDGMPVAEEANAFISIKDEHTGEVRRLGRLSGMATAYYTKEDGGTITEGSKRSKIDNHVMVQSESVDNAKNRTLDNLNLTSETYKAVQAFIELQTSDNWAANSKYWTRLITQPILWEFSAEMKKGNDSFSTSYDPNLFQNVVAKLRTKYQEMIIGEASEVKAAVARIDDVVFDPQTLLRARNLEGNEFAVHQLAALNLFEKLYGIGQRLFDIEAQFNQDVGGAGKDMFVAMDKQSKMSSLDIPPVIGVTDLYRNSDNTLTELGTTYQATVGTALSVISQVLPYRQLQPLFDRVKALTGKPKLSMDYQRSILKAFRSVAYTSGQHWWQDPQSERVRLFYGEESLAKRLQEAKRTWGKDNPFLARLTTKIGDMQTDPDFVQYNAAGKALATDRQNMTTGWLYLLLSQDETERRLGEDLVRYTYLTGGIQDATSFVEYVPAAYLAGTEMSGQLKDLEYQLRTSDAFNHEGLAVQFIQHNPELAWPVTAEQFGQMDEGREYPETFRVPVENDPNYSKFDTLRDMGGEFRPFLSFRSRTEGKWILYMRNTVGGTTFYTRIDTLGNQFSDEYNGLAQAGQRSIFQDNRSLAEQVPAVAAQPDILSLSNNYYSTVFGEERESAFERIGIKEGGEEALQSALTAMSENQKLPQFMRVVAGFYKELGEQNAAKTATELLGAGGMPLQIIFDENLNSPGQAQLNNTIHLNPYDDASSKDAAIVFLHELTHNKLMNVILMGGHDPRIEAFDKDGSYRKMIDKFRKDHPEVVAHLTQLERLRYDALNALRLKLGEETFAYIKEQHDNGTLEGEPGLLYYAFASTQEFVAHVMSEPAVAKFLNEIQNTEGTMTLLEYVWKLFSDLLETFGKALGVEVKDGSILKEALSHTIQLLDLNNAQIRDLTSSLVEGGSFETDTEAYARDVAQMVTSTYGREAQVVNNGLSWEVKLQYKKKAKPTGQRAKILEKLQEQRDSISEALNRVPKENIQQRVQLRVQQREIREQIAELQQDNNIDRIAEVGKRQLEWVDATIAKESATTVEVNLALQTVNIWENLIDILYGKLKDVGETSDAFSALEIAAKKKRIKLMNDKVEKVLTETFRGDVQLTPLDFSDKLKDLDWASANVLALTRAKPLLVQATATLGWREANNRDEHIGRIIQQLEKLEAKMKDAGLTNEMLAEVDEEGTWGLVGRLSGKWYTYLNTKRDELEQVLEATDSSDSLTPEQRDDKKREAWNKYWEELKKQTVFVDTRVFFDVKTGTRITGEDFDKALNKLAKEVGSVEYARELVTKAEARYKDYLTEREAFNEWLDTSVALTEEEKKDKDKAQQAEALKKKKADALKKWLEYNSPIDLLNRLDSGKKISYNSEGDQWIERAPKISAAKEYYNESFKDIEADPKKRAAYAEYKAILQEMISYLPMEVQRKIPTNFLPLVPKDSAGWLAQVLGTIKNWDTALLKALAATDQEEAMRLRPDKIPVMYTQPFGQTREVSNRSTDVIRVLELFSMMALQHRYMGNVLDTINIAENVLKEVNQRRLAGDAEGKPLRHVMDALKYFKDMLVFKKPTELEGKVDSPMYTMNLAKQLKIEREIKALIAEKKELEARMDAKLEQGDFDHEEEEKRIEQIDKQITAYEKDARNIFGSKVADLLISVNQLKSLSYNPFSAAANYTFAEVSLAIHARSRADFDPRTLREATAVMIHSTKKYFLFSEEGDETAQKVHALMTRSGIMGDVVDTEYGKSNLSGRGNSRFLKAISPYNWLRAGDYFTKGKLMVAMLKKKEVEATELGTGKKVTITLWDALDKNGQWDTTKYEPNPEWYSEDIHQQDSWNKYRDRMRKVAMIVFGNQDKNSPLMAKKNWLLRLAGQFRLSWFPEGIATRFKGEYRDINLQRDVKGRWRTYQDLGIVNSGVVVARQLLAALPGVKHNPFEGITDKNKKPLVESAVDMENMRKNFAGLAWTAGVTVSILMLKAIADDDEHKKSGDARRLQLLINMLIRNQQDLMLYSSPSVFNTITGNFLPATQVVVDYINAMKATGHYLFGDTEKEKDAFERWMKKLFKAGIPYPTFTLYNKMETMMTRDLDKLQR